MVTNGLTRGLSVVDPTMPVVGLQLMAKGDTPPCTEACKLTESPGAMAASTPASTTGEGLTNTRTVVLNWHPSSVVTTTVYKIDDDS